MLRLPKQQFCWDSTHNALLFTTFRIRCASPFGAYSKLLKIKILENKSTHGKKSPKRKKKQALTYSPQEQCLANVTSIDVATCKPISHIHRNMADLNTLKRP
jgi:hypothetical protein